jgi:hypothetical protein
MAAEPFRLMVFLFLTAWEAMVALQLVCKRAAHVPTAVL